MSRVKLTLIFYCLYLGVKAQNLVYRDTIPVFENGTQLRNPWAGGINFSSFSSIDLNQDGKQDLALFDKVSGSGGKFRTFINVGSVGEAKYKHAPEYQDKMPSAEFWAIFYDYNNDGKGDIFTYTTGGAKVYKNTSIGQNLEFTLVKPLLYSNYNPSGTPANYNLYCSPVGLPGIADIDNDGDLDILSFSVLGYKLEYHKNMSQELYGNSDSLVYHMVDDCWGDFSENNCEASLLQCPYMKQYQDIINPSSKVLHSGSCIMCFDRDGDSDQDLLLGDIACTSIEYLENGGSALNAHMVDTTKLYPNYPNKASTDVLKMNTFPCTYHLDVNNDGFKDLIASPNVTAGAENFESVWYYQNSSTTPTVNFSFQKKNFLQDEMIELGEGAYPVLFDADADGKKDLIVGNLGYYIGNTNKSKLTYYKNIGSPTAPSFSLITRDYQGLSSYNLFSMAPTFGDLDGDGDKDLIIGSNNGKVHYFENTAGVGNTALYGNYDDNYQNITGSNLVYPQLFDVDKNGTLDLLLGSVNGKITYYKNVGTTTVPSFSLITNSFGGVDVRQTYLGSITGYSTPFMFIQGGVTKLMVGSERGTLFFYDNIDGNLTGTFNRVDTNLYKINEGTRCAPFFEDITSDGLRDLFIGNHAGGVAFFNSTNVNGVGVEELNLENQISVFPNPASNLLTIMIDDAELSEITISMIDLLGKQILVNQTFNKQITIDVSTFSKGIYFIKIEKGNKKYPQSLIKKIILQ